MTDPLYPADRRTPAPAAQQAQGEAKTEDMRGLFESLFASPEKLTRGKYRVQDYDQRGTQSAWEVFQLAWPVIFTAGQRAAPTQNASPAALTDEDIERQYEDGMCLAAGLPRETCPCGFCQKYRTPRPLAASPASAQQAKFSKGDPS